MHNVENRPIRGRFSAKRMVVMHNAENRRMGGRFSAKRMAGLRRSAGGYR
jgi:hypothetical protein